MSSIEELYRPYFEAVADRCRRHRNGIPSDPADCDWPDCGCDPHAQDVIDQLREHGWLSPSEVTELERELKTQ